MTEIELKYQQFLLYHTSGEDGRPRYLEAQKWLDEGWTLERVIAEWHKGDDLIWLLQGLDIIDADTAADFACGCVDALEEYAPDVKDVTAAIRKKDKRLARHEVLGIEGAIPKLDVEPVDPESGGR